MKKVSYLFFLFAVFFNLNCGKNNDMQKLTGSELKQLTEKAIHGDRQANNKLSLFNNEKIPIPQALENMTIDSLLVNNRNYYCLFIQFPDPDYNRLAVYDKLGRLALLDKSLNGEVSLSFVEKDGVKFLKTVESFISKDALSLKRLSLYRLDSTPIKLAFRSYITFAEPNAFLSQDISRFSKDTILTSLSLPSDFSLKFARKDTFIYDPSFNKYISKNNTFDNIIRQQVKNFNISQP